MITDCFGARQLGLSDTETIFVQGVFALVRMLIPIAIGVYTWNVCRTERPHQRTSTLGLDKSQLKGQSEVNTVDAHVPFLRAQPRGVSTALSQAQQHRNDLPHDQIEVWSTVAESDANGTGQRSIV